MAFTRPKAAQIDFDVTNITDPLIRLNSGQSGSGDKDVGIVVERGLDTNAAILWDESADEFVFVNTTEDGTTSGNVTISSYANLQTGTLNTATLQIGGTSVTSTATELNLLDGVTGTLVTEAGTQTLTNKTLTSPTISNPTLTGTYTFTSDATTTPAMTLTANSINDGVGALRINGAQADIFLNPATATHTTITFAVNSDQRVAFGMDNNSDFYITRRTSSTWYDDTFVLDRDTGLLSLGYGATVAGTLTYSTLNDGTTALTSTVAELNILDGVTATANEINTLDGITATTTELNILDGDTAATSTTLVDADRFIVNDAGTMVQVAASDVATYIGAGTAVFKTISVSGQSDVVADSATDTLTFAAGTGISIATDASTDTITITSASTDSVFSSASDFDLITASVTTSEDLGNVADAADSTTYDLGGIAVEGVITSAQISAGSIDTTQLADDAVTSVKLSGLTNSSSGFVQADGDGTFSISSGSGLQNIVEDTSPQLGGHLFNNGFNMFIGDSNYLGFGQGVDLTIKHDGTHSYIIDSGTGNLKIAGSQIDILGGSDGAETMATFVDDGAVTLYYDNSAKIATTSVGVGFDQAFGLSDTDTGISLGANGADTMQFYTGNSERLKIDSSGNVTPGANGTQDLGSASLRWQNIYTSDLNLSNGIGDYTVVEGEEDLFLYNNKSGKVFKFALIEVDPSEATPKIEDLKNGSTRD